MEAPPPDPQRILFVEDQPLVREAVAMLLEVDGHKVVTAADGEQGLKQFAPGAFDLVITDYAMPGMNGGELAAAIRRLSPQQPILLLTAHAAMFEEERKTVAAVDLIVAKPVTTTLLREAIRKVLKTRANFRTAGER